MELDVVESFKRLYRLQNPLTDTPGATCSEVLIAEGDIPRQTGTE